MILEFRVKTETGSTFIIDQYVLVLLQLFVWHLTTWKHYLLKWWQVSMEIRKFAIKLLWFRFYANLIKIHEHNWIVDFKVICAVDRNLHVCVNLHTVFVTMVWIAAVVKSYEPMSRESLAQVCKLILSVLIWRIVLMGDAAVSKVIWSYVKGELVYVLFGGGDYDLDFKNSNWDFLNLTLVIVWYLLLDTVFAVS